MTHNTKLSHVGRVGIILSNLGSPTHYDYWSMRRYLAEFLSDRRVIDYPAWRWQPILQAIILSRRPQRSGAAYQRIWNKARNEGPLVTITRAQALGLAQRFSARYGDQVVVDFAMRYGRPSIAEVFQNLRGFGCERILFFPLYPQYAAATVASSYDALFRAFGAQRHQPALRIVPPYFKDATYIDALTQSLQNGLDTAGFSPSRLLLSYHGLPQRYVDAGDPYYKQCLETTRLVEAHSNLKQTIPIETVFQSKFGPEAWIGPSLVQRVVELAQEGHARIAVATPGFSADCLETIDEVDHEVRNTFIAAGGRDFCFIPSLNDSKIHIDALYEIGHRELQGWLDTPS